MGDAAGGEHRRVLIAGGDADPNLAALAGAFFDRGLSFDTVYVGSRANPRIAWEFEKDALVIDGREVKPKAVFIRYDVFTSMAVSGMRKPIVTVCFFRLCSDPYTV